MTTPSRVLRLSVERAGKHVSYEVHGELALIGSGSHCDVRLLPEDAAPEQLRIELRGEELHVAVLAPERECCLNGQPLRQGVLGSDVPIEIGHVVLRAHVSQAVERNARRGDGSWPLPVRVVGFAAIGFGLYVNLQGDAPVSSLDQIAPQPALFGAPATECAARTDGEAAPHAQRLLREGNLRSERAPFDPRDGVAAVSRYEEAAACLERAGRAEEAQAALRVAASLRQSLSDQFHVRHVRLERYLSIQKYDAAQREVRVLQEFLQQRQGDYAQWLSAVQRELNMRFASTKGKG